MRYSLDDISISGSEDGSKKHLLSECVSDDQTAPVSPTGGFFSTTKTNRPKWSRTFQKALVVTNILVLLGNFLCFIAIVVIIPSWRSSETSSHSALNYSPLQILSPSPAQEALQYELRRFTALGESEWDKPAGDKTDASWDALIDNGKWFAIDQKTFEEINGNPTTGLRIPGDSQGRFYGILQVHHQLHCVDILRRGSWFNIDHYRDKGHFTNMTDREIIRHMRHCTEILRQTIQCHGDTAMLTFNWVHGHDWPQSAWKSLHSCQNWDRLNEWRERNDISHLIDRLERPSWVLDPKAEAPGHRGAAEAVQPIVCRDLECSD